MRAIAYVLVAFLAISGIASADTIEITSPTDDGPFVEGDMIKVQVRYTNDDGNGDSYIRFFLDGTMMRSSTFEATAGDHHIEVKVFDNPQLVNAIAEDEITIYVIPTEQSEEQYE